MAGSFRFEQFTLDPGDRRLRHAGTPVELNARYFDALALLVQEQGRLVAKDRFLNEVWRGVPVTDEALTQCIRTLRRQLGDNAARPRFIETVPKHGYRFIAAVEWAERDGGLPASPPVARTDAGPWREALWLGAAGTAGGGLAGILGGLAYGLAAASNAGPGAVSALLVLAALTAILAVVGGAGVSLGIAAASLARPLRLYWAVLGGAVGGLLVGAMVKLLGLDALNLLFGRAPADMTGAAEGVVLGAAVGLGAGLAITGAPQSLRAGMAAAGLAGSAGGALIALLGGRLMGGSLDLVAREFPGSRLRLDALAALLGEGRFGPRTQLVTATLEGLLFAACVTGAMILMQRRLAGPR